MYNRPIQTSGHRALSFLPLSLRSKEGVNDILIFFVTILHNQGKYTLRWTLLSSPRGQLCI